MSLPKTGSIPFLAIVFGTLLMTIVLQWIRPQNASSLLGYLAICGYGLYIVFCAAFSSSVRYGAIAIPIESTGGRLFHFISGIAFIAISAAITWR
jgi:hypothetical protein